MTKHIYLISGLGADERAFSKLVLPYDFTHLDWIPIANKNESLTDYCIRLTTKIKHDNPIIIGLSLGGIVAIEIAKLIEIEMVILVSTVTKREEIPLSYRLFGKLNGDKITPNWILNKNSNFLDYLFGVKTPESKTLLRNVIKNSDPELVKWSVKQLVNWKNIHPPKNLIRIHGDNDKLLPAKGKIDYLIAEGGHFMVYDKAEELNLILNKL